MQCDIRPVAVVRSPRTDLSDDFWGAVEADIVLDDAFGAEALFGLGDFSHVEILFLMDRVDSAKVETGARHPRKRADWPLVGIFAQRGKARPNRIGLTRAAVVAVDGKILRVRGLDAIDGSPVLDIKPWMDEFGPIGPTRQPAWAGELMRDYFKP
jgi:tRNA (adenine37-N6)-methyltransferase